MWVAQLIAAQVSSGLTTRLFPSNGGESGIRFTPFLASRDES